MNAALYINQFPGPAFEAEIAKARAFCAAQGLVVGPIYHSDFPRDKRLVAEFLALARSGAVEVLLVPFPDCFPTPFLRKLVTAGVGLGVYQAPPKGRA